MSRYSRYGVVLAAVAPTAEILLVLIAGPIANADGVCEKGYRDTTTAERSTMTNVLESVKAALPQAPDGWVIGGYEEISVPGSTCSDSDDTPWTYSFSRTYNRVDDAAERDQAMAEAGAALQADMAAKQPRIDALMAKGQELNVALGEAAQTGDQARIDALNRELQEVQAELESVFNDSSMQSQEDAIGAITMQDRTMDIAVQFNASSSASGDMQSAEVPRGARFAFRGQSTDEGVTNDRALVLFGDWQAREGGILESSKRRGVSSAAAHAIAVTVTADPARLDTLLAAINFEAMAELVD